LLWSFSGANFQWRDGGPIAADGTQRRVNLFPQHIQGQTGAIAQKVMHSPDLYWRNLAERDYDLFESAQAGSELPVLAAEPFPGVRFRANRNLRGWPNPERGVC